MATIDRRKIYKFNGRRIAKGLYQVWESKELLYVIRLDDTYNVWALCRTTKKESETLYTGSSKAECFDYLNDNYEELGVEYIGRERRNYTPIHNHYE